MKRFSIAVVLLCASCAAFPQAATNSASQPVPSIRQLRAQISAARRDLKAEIRFVKAGEKVAEAQTRVEIAQRRLEMVRRRIAARSVAANPAH